MADSCKTIRAFHAKVKRPDSRKTCDPCPEKILHWDASKRGRNCKKWRNDLSEPASLETTRFGLAKCAALLRLCLSSMRVGRERVKTNLKQLEEQDTNYGLRKPETKGGLKLVVIVLLNFQGEQAACNGNYHPRRTRTTPVTETNHDSRRRLPDGTQYEWHTSDHTRTARKAPTSREPKGRIRRGEESRCGCLGCFQIFRNQERVDFLRFKYQ